jgi:cell division protein FtsI (penicillin-binding protein 3)
MGLLDRRIGLLFAIFILLLAGASLRAAWLGTVRAGSLKDRAAQAQVQDLKVAARRGTITDRHGTELAVSEDGTSVWANPHQVTNPTLAAAKLAPVLGMTQNDLLKLMSDRNRGFVYLRRKLDPDVAGKVAKLKITGVGTVIEPRRTYPQGALAGQLIGAVGTDNYGLSGLEQEYEKELHGTDGERRVVKDGVGQTVNIIEPKHAVAGKDIRLTIDAPLQERVEAVISQIGRDSQPKGATAVVMDPRSGELLALANWPRVDPSDVGATPESALQNRAVISSYEPGSTFKAFTVASAIQDRKITPQTRFDLPPVLKVADREIGEAHDRGFVNFSTADILAQSSNVGAAMIGMREGSTRFDHFVRKFGFGSKTGIGLPGETPGIVLHPKKYSGSTLANMSMGQGLAVTPLQMAAGYSALANGGVYHRPHVIASQHDHGRRVVSTQTAGEVAHMLEGVLGDEGTGSAAKVEGYTLAGKTGTAEKPDAAGGYSKTKFVGSFIGFAPARNPRLMVAVMVDEPTLGSYYGGEVAAPAFEKILEFALPYLRIPPN